MELSKVSKRTQATPASLATSALLRRAAAGHLTVAAPAPLFNRRDDLKVGNASGYLRLEMPVAPCGWKFQWPLASGNASSPVRFEMALVSRGWQYQ